ncbi:MAG: hypothetical protein NT003_00290 [Candidatus Magasanikbacteria bacterium]|nr:hypothetical protein [Candidatus Magasanikbacteria bacterium]
MVKRRIITHRKPHLDEIACIWLVKRFLPGWEDCSVGYIPTNPKGGAVKNPDQDVDVMYIGVGRGKFDEHKGNLADSATTLIYKFISREKKVKFLSAAHGAIEELVNFINDDDHGLHITLPHSEFMFSSANSFMAQAGYSSPKILEAGLAYLDGVYVCLLEKHLLERDWKKAKFIKTKWGSAVALQTSVSPKTVLRRSVQEGILIAIVVNPKNNFRSIRAVPESSADFTEAFEQVRTREPQAEWYLHHSKKMLICGSDVASNVSLSKLPLSSLSATIAV